MLSRIIHKNDLAWLCFLHSVPGNSLSQLDCQTLQLDCQTLHDPNSSRPVTTDLFGHHSLTSLLDLPNVEKKATFPFWALVYSASQYTTYNNTYKNFGKADFLFGISRRLSSFFGFGPSSFGPRFLIQFGFGLLCFPEGCLPFFGFCPSSFGPCLPNVEKKATFPFWALVFSASQYTTYNNFGKADFLFGISRKLPSFFGFGPSSFGPRFLIQLDFGLFCFPEGCLPFLGLVHPLLVHPS